MPVQTFKQPLKVPMLVEPIGHQWEIPQYHNTYLIK